MPTPDLNQAILDVLVSRGYEEHGRVTVNARALARLNDAYRAATK